MGEGEGVTRRTGALLLHQMVELKNICIHSPFLHYPLVPSFKKINIGNTGNQNPPEGGFWLPVFPILIFVSR